MRMARTCITALLAVSLLALLGGCADPADDTPPAVTWSAVSSYNQMLGTWHGTASVNIPEDVDAGTPAFSQTVDYTITYGATSITMEMALDMSALIATYDAQQAGTGALIWAVMGMTAGTTTDTTTGMTTTISFSSGSPYIMTTTTTGTIDPGTFSSTGLEINSTGTQIKITMDDETSGVTEMILTKQ